MKYFFMNSLRYELISPAFFQHKQPDLQQNLKKASAIDTLPCESSSPRMDETKEVCVYLFMETNQNNLNFPFTKISNKCSFRDTSKTLLPTVL